MNNLKDFNLSQSKVLVRCDFNVPLDDQGKILDDSRIEEDLPTINYLIENQAKVILISHLGRPLRNDKLEKDSLKPVASQLGRLLDREVRFGEDCIGPEAQRVVDEMKPGQVLLLENLRFHPGETKNSQKFTKQLSQLGEFYINNAFSASHRAHASIVGIPEHLPSAPGLLFEKELKILSKVKEKPWHPLAIILGGVKVPTKVKLLPHLLEIGDQIMLGGMIANAILKVKMISLGKPWPQPEVVQQIKNLELTDTQLHLPLDVVVSPDKSGEVYIKQTAPGKVQKGEVILDIGPETIEHFSSIIEEAKMIVWNGPLGVYEQKRFEKGTKQIVQAIAKNHKAFKIAGGGDTSAALFKFGLEDKFDHISSGGGAMLRFLSGQELPGIKALQKSNE